MSGNNEIPGDQDPVEDDSTTDVSDDDVVMSTDENVVDEATVEINVEALVENVDADEAARVREVKEKLEALNEQRDDKFGSTYNFNIDEDL